MRRAARSSEATRPPPSAPLRRRIRRSESRAARESTSWPPEERGERSRRPCGGAQVAEREERTARDSRRTPEIRPRRWRPGGWPAAASRRVQTARLVFTAPALRPFSMAICTGSAAETWRVKLLSAAHARHAPAIARAPHGTSSSSRPIHESVKAPPEMKPCPQQCDGRNLVKTNHASSTVNTPSKLSNNDVLDAGALGQSGHQQHRSDHPAANDRRGEPREVAACQGAPPRSRYSRESSGRPRDRRPEPR